MSSKKCVFCKIIAGTSPAQIVHSWPDAIAITPIDPVTYGHTLIMPIMHVDDAKQDPKVTAYTMQRAAEFADHFEYSNILTSIGRPATQSIFHLHVHVLPRREDDQLMVPWGTMAKGDPHAPHWCKQAEELKGERDFFKQELANEAMRNLERF